MKRADCCNNCKHGTHDGDFLIDCILHEMTTHMTDVCNEYESSK